MGESKKGSNGFNVGMLIFAILVGAFIIMMHYPEVINGMIGSATIGS